MVCVGGVNVKRNVSKAQFLVPDSQLASVVRDKEKGEECTGHVNVCSVVQDLKSSVHVIHWVKFKEMAWQKTVVWRV